MENLAQLRLIGEGVARMASGPKNSERGKTMRGSVVINTKLAENISCLDTIGAPLPDRQEKKDYVPPASDVIFRMYHFGNEEIS